MGNKEKQWNEKARQYCINMNFKYSVQKAILSDVKNTPKNLPKNISSQFIYGNSRNGKSVYAAFLMLEAYKNQYLKHGTFRGNYVEPNIKYIFVNYLDILSELKQSFSDVTKNEFDILNKYVDAAILVIDDWGTTKPSDWAFDIFYALIEKRMLHERVTIITSNNGLEKIGELWDDRIRYRIEETYEVIKLPHWQGS